MGQVGRQNYYVYVYILDDVPTPMEEKVSLQKTSFDLKAYSLMAWSVGIYSEKRITITIAKVTLFWHKDNFNIPDMLPAVMAVMIHDHYTKYE